MKQFKERLHVVEDYPGRVDTEHLEDIGPHIRLQLAEKGLFVSRESVWKEFQEEMVGKDTGSSRETHKFQIRPSSVGDVIALLLLNTYGWLLLDLTDS